MQLRSLGAAALAVGVLLVGAAPALATGGGNDTLGEAAQGGHGRRASASTRARSTWPRSRPAATGSRARKGHELSADYVALRRRLAGLNVSRFRTSTTTCSRSATGSRRCSTSGAASTTSRASPARSRAATSAR